MSGRTDPFLLTVSNHTTGQRYSFAGTKKQCEEQAKAKLAEWKKDRCERAITKR